MFSLLMVHKQSEQQHDQDDDGGYGLVGQAAGSGCVTLLQNILHRFVRPIYSFCGPNLFILLSVDTPLDVDAVGQLPPSRCWAGTGLGRVIGHVPFLASGHRDELSKVPTAACDRCQHRWATP